LKVLSTESKIAIIRDSLKKHFGRVYVEEYISEGVVSFSCFLLIDDDDCLEFPVYLSDIEDYPPQIIVNALWEYIIKYML